MQLYLFIYLFVWSETDRKDEEKEGEDKSQPRSIRDRRRPREKRRSTGVSFWTQDVRHSQITFITVISIPSACGEVQEVINVPLWSFLIKKASGRV